MRVNELSVKKHSNLTNPVEVMKYIRQEKDNFKS